MMKTPHRKGVGKGIDWRLTRFLLSHLALGAVSGWIFVGALFYFNVGGLGDLIADPVSGPLAAVMLLIVVTITWGSAAMGTAVFLLPRDEEECLPANILGRRAVIQPTQAVGKDPIVVLPIQPPERRAVAPGPRPEEGSRPASRAPV